jgi:hypothetical protein
LAPFSETLPVIVSVAVSTTSIAPRRAASSRVPSAVRATPVIEPPALTPPVTARVARSTTTTRPPAAMNAREPSGVAATPAGGGAELQPRDDVVRRDVGEQGLVGAGGDDDRAGVGRGRDDAGEQQAEQEKTAHWGYQLACGVEVAFQGFEGSRVRGLAGWRSLAGVAPRHRVPPG